MLQHRGCGMPIKLPALVVVVQGVVEVVLLFSAVEQGLVILAEAEELILFQDLNLTTFNVTFNCFCTHEFIYIILCIIESLTWTCDL